MDHSGAALIAVVVVNWERARDTLTAYASLKESSCPDWHLYVVDNASADDSAEELRRELGDRSSLIINTVNGGFSGGCNRGIREALSSGHRYIFLLNNDATVNRETLDALIKASEAHADQAILGTLIKYASDNTYQFIGAYRRKDYGHPAWYNEVDNRELLKLDFIPTDFVHGASMFLPASLLNRVGLLDERYYLNYEETDLCYRAAQAGYKLLLVTDAVVYHEGSATMGVGLESPLQAYFVTRNELLFAETHATPLQRLRHGARTLYWTIKRLKLPGRAVLPLNVTFSASMLGLLDYLFRRFGDCPASVRSYSKQWRAERHH